MRTNFAVVTICALLALNLSACDSGVNSAGSDADDLSLSHGEALGKRERSFVCHVGSELPAYDPGCTEGCGDAGKVDLILVPDLARHIGNPGHAFGGLDDFEPIAAGATGIGTEDSDGDGIDDGCEVDPGRVIGTITEDILRGGNPPGTDRGVESAAANFVADVHMWATSANGAQIAFMNPGGVRSDLVYAGGLSGGGDGEVTLGEAFIFQPFGNTLQTIPMTGAQIVSVLEEQCQPAGSTPFLHLGVSIGFTYDLSREIVAGNCVSVSVSNARLNGVPLDPGATYQVTVNNFLADGGDHFATFASVAPSLRQDGGHDFVALLGYFGAFSPVAPPGTDRVNELP